MVKGFRFKKDRSEASDNPRDADFSKLEEGSDSQPNLKQNKEKAVSTEGDDQTLNQSQAETDNRNQPASGDVGRLEELKARCDALRAELQDASEKQLRVLADFDNFKKRAIKERSELQKYAGENLVVDLLEVLDNFERALENIDSDQTQFKEGVKLIHRMLGDVLRKHGIAAESAIGKKFEPQKHNALSQSPSESVETGHVVSELKKAYFYKDKLIRIGDVVVSSGPAVSPASNENDPN